jgi:hypothetical protein
MASFAIRIYGTQKLHNAEGMTPLERTKTWLDEAINTYSEHSATITAVSDFKIDAPTEQSQTRFYAPDPCVGGPDKAWDYLSNWWHDHVACNIGNSHCDLLITNYDGQLGRCAENVASVSEGGPKIADLPTDTSDPSHYSNGGAFDSLQTAMHEVGHALMYGGQDGFSEHNVGDEYYVDGQGYRTPFHNSDEAKDSGTNECGDSIDPIDYGYWYMHYSECCESKMRE